MGLKRKDLRGCLIIFWGCCGLIYLLNVVILGIPYWIAHTQWQQQNIRSYTVVVMRGVGSLGRDGTLEVVVNGRRNNLRDESSGEPTIDSTFRQVRDCMLFPFGFYLCGNFDYDPDYGFPAKFMQFDGDLGVSWSIELVRFAPTS